MKAKVFYQALKKWLILCHLYLKSQTILVKISSDFRIGIYLRKDCVNPSGFCLT